MTAAAHCKDLISLSDYVGYAPQHIFSLIANQKYQYVKIKIPKHGSDEYRVIFIPSTSLKGVQRSILSKIISEYETHTLCFSYKKGISVVDAATKLCGNKNVLKIDIRNFFPSIDAKRVFGFFASKNFDPKVAWMLTRLCTFKEHLAQGSPTSPMLSNLICFRLDEQMDLLSNRWDLNYIRYSDDMFIYSARMFNHTKIVNIVDKILKDNGFRRNQKKTRFYLRGKTRFTLGLETSGSKPKLSRKYRRTIRGLFHKASRNPSWAIENIELLTGHAEWYKCVYGKGGYYISFRNTLRTIHSIRYHEPYKI